MRSLFIFIVLLLCSPVNSQVVSVMDVDESLEGACDLYNVYGLYNGREGQKQAIPPLPLEQIKTKLDSGCTFVKANPRYKGSVAVHCIINCKGELIKCQSFGRWGEPQLRTEVVAVFKTLLQWTPGELNGRKVDCVEDFRIGVDRGVITVESSNIY